MSSEPRLTSLAHGGGCGCKIAPDVLTEILSSMPAAATHVGLLVDAAKSDDAAVYRISDEAAVIATTDFFMPIVDDPFDFGRIAATNALSDVYAMGGRPIFSLAITGMPVGKMSTETIRRILDGGRMASEAAGAPVAGGHSIDSAEPIYGLVALGLVHPDRLIRNDGARAGDVLILGKPLGVGVFSAALKQEQLSPEGYEMMIGSTTLLNRPGADIAEIDGVHAMTDVTGFGLLGHLAEICRGSGVAAAVEESAVPVFDLARNLLQEGIKTGASGRNWNSVKQWVEAPADWPEMSRDMLTDPQTSGGLLVSCAPEAADAVLTAFRQHGHGAATVIGAVTEGAPKIRIG
ncbi:MAG: selenide, water dikinase SelD [Parvularcula sp.]|nr:selenide, water dikinase SelD [Parvularcula sp.]